jgi:hypothetical protein
LFGLPLEFYFSEDFFIKFKNISGFWLPPMNAAAPPPSRRGKKIGVSRFAAAAEGQKSRRAAADLNIFGFGLCKPVQFFSYQPISRTIFGFL